MVIFSVPTPDLVETIEDEKQTFAMIADAAKKLEKDGCHFIIIACNSLQYLIEKLQTLVKIPIISMAEKVTVYLKTKGYKKVGILATNTTVQKNIYKRSLEQIGISLIAPSASDQKVVEEVILNLIGGKGTVEDKQRISNVINNLQQEGANAILLACTELPLIIKPEDTNMTLIDCNEIYAVEAAKLASTGI